MWVQHKQCYMTPKRKRNRRSKERHKKERERRNEQSKKRVPYEPFVTLNGLQGATHLNGQRVRVMDKMRNTGRYPVKLRNGTLPSVKEENMIQEDTRGAEGKEKGNERKELMLDSTRRAMHQAIEMVDIGTQEHTLGLGLDRVRVRVRVRARVRVRVRVRVRARVRIRVRIRVWVRVRVRVRVRLGLQL